MKTLARKRAAAFTAMFLGFVFCFLLPSSIYADTNGIDSATSSSKDKPAVLSLYSTAAAADTITVSGNTSTEIRTALKEAGQMASDSHRVTVILPARTYTIENPLLIFSNTTLQIEKGAVLNCAQGKTSGAMLYGVNLRRYLAGDYSLTNYYGYDEFKNISIIGGTWDAGGKDLPIMSLRHGNNISISDATLQNSANHMINISASKNATISNVELKNAVRPAKATQETLNTIECIHTDFESSVGEGKRPNDPSDGTPAGDIVIKNCTFSSVYAGIGAHSSISEIEKGMIPGEKKAYKYKGTKTLTITGNTFTNVSGNAIDLSSMDNVTISNNKVTGKAPNYFVYVKDSKNVSLQNNGTIAPVSSLEKSNVIISAGHTILNSANNSLWVGSGSNMQVTGLNVVSPKNIAARVEGKSVLTATNSKFNKAGSTAVSIDGGSTVKLTNCEVNDAGAQGIGSSNSSITAESCTISRSKTNGFWAESSTVVLKKTTIASPGTNGISLSNCVKAQVADNKVTSAGERGIYVSGSSGSSIMNNTVLESVHMGIAVNDSPNVTIKGNESCSRVVGKRDYYINAKCSGTVLEGNKYSGRGISVESGAVITNRNNVLCTTHPAKAVWTRLQGSGGGAYGTMQRIVENGWAQGCGGTVVIARGDNFMDALAASGLAGLEGAPIVITKSNALTKQSEDILKRIKPNKVIIAGGALAVSESVANQIYNVTGVVPTRLTGGKAAWGTGGAVGTSIAIANAGRGRWSTTAVLATYQTFQDALSVAPIAYAKNMPVYLTNGKTIDANVLRSMKENGITKVVIIGGPLAVDRSIENTLKNNNYAVERKQGSGGGAAGTSAVVAKWGISLGMSADNMGVATLQSFHDALSGAALCGKRGSVLVLADDKRPLNTAFPTSYKDKIYHAYVFGGPLAVGEKTFKSLEKSTE